MGGISVVINPDNKPLRCCACASYFNALEAYRGRYRADNYNYYACPECGYDTLTLLNGAHATFQAINRLRMAELRAKV